MRILLVLLTTILASKLLPAQNQNDSIPKGYYTTRWLIQFKPLQAIFVEFPVSVEYGFNKHGFGLEVAYRPSWKRNLAVIDYEYIERLWENYRALNYFNPLQNAITVGTFHKIYFDRWRCMHLKTHFYYRHWWFNEKETSYRDKVRPWEQGYQFSGIRTERQNIYGVKATFGATFSIDVNKKLEVILEPYVGFGYRYRTFYYQTRDGKFWDEPVDYVEERGGDHIFTYQIGLSLGFGSNLIRTLTYK